MSRSDHIAETPTARPGQLRAVEVIATGRRPLVAASQAGGREGGQPWSRDGNRSHLPFLAAAAFALAIVLLFLIFKKLFIIS